MEHTAKPKFEQTSCSQCGREFGPGDHGYSHCFNHQPPEVGKRGPMSEEYLEQMRVHVDEDGQLTHRNAVDLLCQLEAERAANKGKKRSGSFTHTNELKNAAARLEGLRVWAESDCIKKPELAAEARIAANAVRAVVTRLEA